MIPLLASTIQKESDLVRVSSTANAEPVAPDRSFASSVKTHYKPYGNIHFRSNNARDFRTHEEQERIQLDWLVRNTAKILGKDAVRTLHHA
jgi:hypothetical protein